MRFLALDVGERRVGIAISESGLLATPHSILQRKSKKEDFARLQRLVAELEIDRIIVGLPYSLNEPGQLGPQAQRIKRYAELLADVVDVPLEYADESYSSVEAQTYVGRRRASPGKKSYIDDAAAAVILQKYLDTVWNRSSGDS